MRCALIALCTCLVVSPTNAQTRTVAGRVTDAVTGSPISAGEVAVSGSTVRDRLRPDGVFVLHVPDGPVTLEVRGPGYRTRELIVARHDQAVIIPLTPLAHRLTPMVFSAGDTSAASSARLDGAPATSLLEAIQGKVAGLDIQRNSGVPGGDLQFRLRGVNTILGSTSPLYIIDGVIVSDGGVAGGAAGVTLGQAPVSNRIADLNPADIASIEILTGARATRYGSRGANGVVLIRTKRD